MRWRCAECGRPHDARPDACECGSESFERGVVKLTKECTTCGEAVPEEADTCPECGFTSFESLAEPDLPDESERGYVEFRCVDCGKSHPKHTPPCDRCGGVQLERTYVDGDSVDPHEFIDGTPWWKLELDRVTLFGLSLVLGVLILFASGVAGIGPAAGLVAPDVDETALERGVYDGLDDDGRVGQQLSRDETLDGIAAEATRQSVDGGERQSDRELFTAAGYECDAPMTRTYSYEAEPLESPDEPRLADRIVTLLLSDPTDRETLSGASAVGVDARQDHRTIVVGVAAC
jgi:ribosomal protein S26